MSVIEIPKPVAQPPQLWPLSIEAYRMLGELGLIPKTSGLTVELHSIFDA